MITSGSNTIMFSAGTTFLVSSLPGLCACGRIAYLFKNRNGRTLCLTCADFMVAPSEGYPNDDEGPDAAAAFEKAIV
jgi:hypothetical protein